MEVTNTLTYYGMATLTTVKIYICDYQLSPGIYSIERHNSNPNESSIFWSLAQPDCPDLLPTIMASSGNVTPIRIDQLPVSATSWQHGFQICLKIF
jgi:hypothetical protein